MVDFLQTEDAPVLDADGQSTDPWPPQAELDAAFAGAKTTHEATYRTEVQTHSSLETHGAVAKWTGKDPDVWSSTQASGSFPSLPGLVAGR